MSRDGNRSAHSIFANTGASEIFPTPLWILDLKHGVHEPLNRSLRSRIDDLLTPRPSIGIGIPLQTDPILHTVEEFGDLLSIVRNAVSATLDSLDTDHEGFEITGFWATVNPTGAFNSSRNHPNNYLSGVYYVATPPNSGNIEFVVPRLQASSIVPAIKRRNKFNFNSVSLDVKPGRLVLFPAWLVYSVRVNQSLGDRITISFNAMFTDFGTRMPKPLWTKGTVPIPHRAEPRDEGLMPAVADKNDRKSTGGPDS